MPTRTSHQPIRLGPYQEIHNTVIDQFRSRNFIGTETLRFEGLACGLLLKGEIGCLGNIVIAVEKFVEILSGSGTNAIVQTRWYSYNVFIRGHYNIFRYDNQDDEYLRPGHRDEHHKHIFDWRTGEELPESPIWVGFDGWLNLGQVIQEVEDWYWQHRQNLPSFDTYPDLELR